MPPLRGALRLGGERRGGVTGYPLDELFEEVAYVAFHFHWPHDEILRLEHRERRKWVHEIAKLNRALTEASQGA
jgi:hypothetical protein